MDIAELDRFISRYYEVGEPERVTEALEAASGHEAAAGVDVAYFFAAVARRRPELWSEYRDLFTTPELTRSGRLLVLGVLRFSADERTLEFLEACAEDEALASVSEDIRSALDRPLEESLDVLSMPVESPAHLDLLWAEFHASGDPSPVRRVIDVLERPDTVREQLEAYLGSPPRGWIRRWLRRRALGKLEARGLFLTADRREIWSAQDLDCLCATNRFEPSREVWDGYRKLLPFLPAEAPAEIMLKAAARWSLATNASQHERVLDVCGEEAEARAGRVRLALLEVVALTKIGGGDVGGGFQALRASLDPDPGARSDVERELAAVMELPVRAVQSTRFSPRGAATTLSACAAWTGKSTSYCSKTVVRHPTDGDASEAVTSWDLIAMRPGTYRVQRVSDSVADEWIASGRHHFHGPGFAPLDPRESGSAREHAQTRWLLVDKFLAVLHQADPVALEERSAGDRAYHVVEYGAEVLAAMQKAADGPVAPAPARADDEGVLRLWIDAETKRLARAEWELVGDGPEPGTDAERHLVVQGFAAYDRAPDVVPPPFQLLESGDG